MTLLELVCSCRFLLEMITGKDGVRARALMACLGPAFHPATPQSDQSVRMCAATRYDIQMERARLRMDTMGRGEEANVKRKGGYAVIGG